MAARVLVLDDDPDWRYLVALRLRRQGMVVVETDSAHEAFAQAGEVDAVLVDLAMPDIDGLTVIEQIRQDHHDLPIVVVSAHAYGPMVEEALRIGATMSISKDVVLQSDLEAVLHLA